MKFTLSWLKEHLETEKSLEDITDKLTSIGLEVQNVNSSSLLNSFVIAKILTAERHPNADKLQVLNVDIGKKKFVQLVCGASNVRAGLISVFAPPGTYIPGLKKILTVGKIRGIKSFGMMCSEHELLLSNEHNGIIELSANAPLGVPFFVYAGLDDPVIDINLTPNRSDCASVYGIARDLSTAGIGALRKTITPIISGKAEKTSMKIKIESNDEEPLCLGFAWRVIKDIKNGPSPEWIQHRLTSIGLHPINSLIDIINYLTFDRGYPLYTFDADKINNNLTIRLGRKGEKVLALNDKEYILSSKNCVIADDNNVVSIAGIIGGKKTACDEKTRNIIIKSALWNSDNIAQTGRELGIISDARYRFERGVDPNFMLPGLELTTKMILDICGGKPTEIEVIGFTPPIIRKVQFPFSEIRRLTSLDVPRGETITILNNLGFKTIGEGQVLTVQVPSWRTDINEKADLVEEVIRIYGVDRIKPQPLLNDFITQDKILTPLQIRTRNTRRALACRGMLEIITWSFISEKNACIFGGGKSELKLSNPISSDMSNMRPSLLPGLIKAAQQNVNLGFSDIAFFEVSDTYEGNMPEKQRRVASGIRRNTAGLNGSGRFWNGNATAVSVFDAKADAITALESCGIAANEIQIESSAPSWYHPSRSGAIILKSKIILGYFGEFHPNILDTLNVHGPLCGFEIFIDAVPETKKKDTKKRAPLVLSHFQKIIRDFSFVVDKNITAASIIHAAEKADKKLIDLVQVFDFFEEKRFGVDKKSIAIEVSIQPVERTLTDEDLEILSTKIVNNVIKISKGYLRK
ncbi:MAG: phenylalanyl-tRNA synthetase beta chain [Candidatus Tokpelaia sp. JSC188]|nr:MAG: phenylalanyl-tRNA synthetase beta chain [Candidatus Tokpelaia sp. JSC188]